MAVVCSPEMKRYFDELDGQIKSAYDSASKAREKGYDPDDRVEIQLARNMGERVEGLVSVIVPQIKGSGVVQRLFELEKKFGLLDWRVGLTIGLEVANEKFCRFKDKHEAMESGIRVGLAYMTLGVVSSPLEGFVKLKMRKRRDGGDYVSVLYSGPIRSAGGTMAAVSVLIADYIRKEMGYGVYDPSDDEVKRTVTELYDYHERVTNLQYLPSEQEIALIAKNLPVQIDGDPSEKFEVSNYKDLARIDTNRIRNGICLVIGEGIAQKAVKIAKQLEAWGKDFGLEHWSFMSDFVKLQKKIKAKGGVESSTVKILPDNTFIKDVVAGRPVLTYPLRAGGFRLRYGRSRTSGFSSMSMHPATMVVLDDYIATGTQLKYERPGKSSAMAPCDSIEGPIVKLDTGEVVFLDTVEEARKHKANISEILFMGDYLVNYAEFYHRGHKLVPAGYCEDWWKQDLKKALNEKRFEKDKLINDILRDPVRNIPSCKDAINLSEKLDVPLHPRYTYHWKDISIEDFLKFAGWISTCSYEDGKLILDLNLDAKRVMEILGIPHNVIDNMHVVLDQNHGMALAVSLGFSDGDASKLIEKIENLLSDNTNVLDIVNKLSTIKIMDKSGTYIGARMGRPEKAKIRKLTGAPQALFPVGNEGGKMRSINAALDKGRITADYPIYRCENCNKETIFSVCETCDKKTVKLEGYRKQQIDINYYFKQAVKRLDVTNLPDMIKGVRGTSNEDHIPENLMKGILRAMNKLHVNKDGTIRYDMTEMPLTHFKPVEVGTSIEKLRKMGYLKDCYGNELSNEQQILEIKPQDIILPTGTKLGEEGADEILFRTANFVDDLLVKMYGLPAFYNVKSKKDMVGQLVIGIAPHISAGIVGRVIGFSEVRGCYAHPMWHAAQRRDCVYPETKLFFYDNKKKDIFYGGIGEYVEKLIREGAETKIIDGVGTISVENKKEIYGIGIDPVSHEMKRKKIKYFIKGPRTTEWVKVKTVTNREYVMTPTHKFMYIEEGKFKFKDARKVNAGDKLPVLSKFNFELGNNNLNLFRIFYDGLSESEKREVIVINNGKEERLNKIYENYCLDELDNWNSAKMRWKWSRYQMPIKFRVSKELMRILGYYAAEGWSRKSKWVSQIAFRICNNEMQEGLVDDIRKAFGIQPCLGEENSKITICNKLVYYLFKCIGVGNGAYQKRVPNFIFGLNKALVREYISAYFEGDGSVINKKHIVFYSVARGLLDDVALLLAKFEILGRYFRTEARLPGRKVLERYKELGREPRRHVLNHLVLGVYDSFKLGEVLSVRHREKASKIELLKPSALRYINYGGKRVSLMAQSDYVEDFVKEVEIVKEDRHSYCVEIEWKEKEDRNVLWGEQIINTRCDGDENCAILLMDGLLNFSRKFLPAHRGATQDAPLLLVSQLIPTEVDDMVFALDVAWEYPLEIYYAALEYKDPKEVKVEQIMSRLGTENQFEGMGFTHDISNINIGVNCSAYKSIPTMKEKVFGQMMLAEKIRAVDQSDVARLIIERHFIRDIRGNLRKFSAQQFRCVSCNEKYRRPPLVGRCVKCNGNLLFTVAEGSVIKYLEPSLELAEKYELPAYLRQVLELTKRRIESVFGKNSDKQVSLAKWFG